MAQIPQEEYICMQVSEINILRDLLSKATTYLATPVDNKQYLRNRQMGLQILNQTTTILKNKVQE